MVKLKMKKRIIGNIALVVCIASVMSGCGNVVIKSGEATQNEESKSVKMNDTGQEADRVLYTATYPAEYYLSYEVTTADGIVKSVSKAVDQVGNVYYDSGQEEYLFVKDGKNYSLFHPENNEFVSDDKQKYQYNYIEDLTKAFDEYVKKADLNTWYATYLKDNEVCGKPCMTYGVEVSLSKFIQKYQFSIDNQYYICLEWKSEKEVFGHEEDGDKSFLCTRFDTDNIDLLNELDVIAQ